MSSYFLDIIFIYVGIMSPYLVFCSYGLLKRFSRIASPWLVFPSVIGTCGFFFFIRAFNTHFIFAAAFILTCYSLLLYKLKYSKVDALVLGVLTMMAIDQMWQVPYFFYAWTNLWAFTGGIWTAAWNLMSIPFLFYFVVKINGRIKLDIVAKWALALCFLWTSVDVLAYTPGSYPFVNEPYFLVLPWFAFFMLVFRSSMPVLNVFGNPMVFSEAGYKGGRGKAIQTEEQGEEE